MDSKVTHDFTPGRLDDTQGYVTLLTTDKRDPKFADEAGVDENLGFSIDLADLPRGQRSFDVQMKFGATTIEVAAFRKGLDDDDAPVEIKVVPFEKRFANSRIY